MAAHDSAQYMHATIRQLIDARAASQGAHVFLINPELEREITYSQLKTGADELGARLDNLGVAAGAKVAFLLDNGAWAAPMFLGIMANNRVAVPLNAVAGPTQLQHVLAHSDCELIFVAPGYHEKLLGLLVQIDSDVPVVITSEEGGPDWEMSGLDAVTGRDVADKTPPPEDSNPALLLYTSGSTGVPKGVILSHRALINGGRNVAVGHGLSKHDRALCVLPVYHINGAMVTVCAPLYSGGSVVMPNRFSARSFWQLAARYQCTWASVVPTMINYLLERANKEPFVFGSAAQLKNFRFGRSASAPLPPTVLQQWERVFHVPMIETLGMTETAGTIATNPMPPAIRKQGSVGRACGVEIKIVNINNADGDRDCAANTVGEIVIRGRSLLDAYYKDAKTTRAAFLEDWFRSGDIGFIDDDHYLFLTGRIKELIVRGGENIAPREIDDALYMHEAVLEAAAVGVDDINYGQEVVACVVLREGFIGDAQALQDFCRARVGEVKMPKAIYFLTDLPKGPSGKILRLELRKIIETMTMVSQKK